MVLGTQDIKSEYLPSTDNQRIQQLEREMKMLRETCSLLAAAIQGIMALMDIDDD